MNKIKIAIASYHYEGINPYGSSVYVQKLLTVLSKNHDNFSVDFYCPYPLKKFKVIDKINYIFIPVINKPFLRYVSFAFKVSKLIKKKQNDPYDIIHSNGGVVIFLKNVDFEVFHHYEKFTFENLFLWLDYQIRRLSLYKAIYIFAISKRAYQEILKYEKINPKRIILLNQSIDFSKFKFYGNRNESNNHDLINKILLFIGRLEFRKKPFLAIETLKYILDNKINCKLLIIGQGPLKKTLEKYSKKLNVSRHVEFLGNVENVIPYYSEADILLIPSRYEGFGLPYLEGPACGVKFIGFNTGIAEIAARLCLGKLADNEKDFKQKALEMLKNNEKISELSIKKAEKFFSIQKWGDNISRIYHNYINNKNQRD